MSAKREKIERKRRSLVATHGQVLVRFSRPFEPGTLCGFVLDVGPQFFLLAEVTDNIRFNGFQCCRLEDVRRLNLQQPGAKFPIEALKKRGLKTPQKPKVDLSSVQRLLETASKASPVVTIFTELVDPEVCYIGKVMAVKERTISLLEIGPDAEWDEKPTRYKLSEITRVDFGGDYEDALILVGGKPPGS